MRRFCAALACLFGVLLIAALLLGDTVGKAAAGERLIDGARPTAGAEGLVRLRADFDTLDAGIAETLDGVFPQVSAGLGITPEALNKAIEEGYPATAAFLDRREEVSGALDKTVSNLEAHRADFAAADDLPAPGVPLRSVPIVGFVVGATLIGLGVWAWLRPAAAVAGWIVAAFGVVMVVSSLALQVPSKLSATQSLVRSLNITEATAAKTREQFELTKASTIELREQLLPDLAAGLGMSDEQFDAALADRFPAAVAALRDGDAILGRIEADVRFREREVDDFAAIRHERLALEGWLGIGFGVVVALVGLGAALGGGPLRRVEPFDTGERVTAPGALVDAS